jgi:hypothetical protein
MFIVGVIELLAWDGSAVAEILRPVFDLPHAVILVIPITPIRTRVAAALKFN